MRFWMFLTKPELLDWIDDLEENVTQMPGTTIGIHKYGGIGFNYMEKEFAHVHSNGLLDVLLNTELKNSLMAEGKIKDHHVFKNSGWISFYLQNKQDVGYACILLDKAYDRAKQKHNSIQLDAI
ncbi:luciferase family protein [Sphingobacterium sp. NGMCC 1.201703]|uniref:luciferase domain-containing protein n=1 Tax=Sphingobacterium sp. NGMCC 1.201703 TaxID=3388657 RepID=UPI0039FC6564